MAILKVFEEKVGARTVINVDTTLDHLLVLPRLCPCCMELSEPPSFMRATCEHLAPVCFPACKVCARHTAFFNHVHRVMGSTLLVLSILTVAGVLVYRGMDAVDGGDAGAWWQYLGALSNLRFPFLHPINALVSLLGGGLVLLVYALIYMVVMVPVTHLFCKPSCKWFNQAARMSRGYSSEAGGYFRRFIFENAGYAMHFRRANTPAVRAPGQRPADASVHPHP